MRPATQAKETFLGAPRALSRLLVGLEALVDRVGDPSFQRSEGFLFGFAFGEFLFVVDPTGGFESDRPEALMTPPLTAITLRGNPISGTRSRLLHMPVIHLGFRDHPGGAFSRVEEVGR